MKNHLLKKILHRVLLGAALVFAAIQLVPVDRNNPPVKSDIAAPPEVQTILRKACYDCHSHESVWPWYGNIAPVSWLVASDIVEARKELNFSIWGEYDLKRKVKKLNEMTEELEENKMPPSSYLFMHSNAALSAQELQTMHEWLRAEISNLTANISEASAKPAEAGIEQGANSVR